jgi:hypothetical protein
LVAHERLVESKAHQAVIRSRGEVMTKGEHGVAAIEVVGVANTKGHGGVELVFGREHGVHGA